MTVSILDQNKLMRLVQAGAMAGGFLLLLCEIRFEHRAMLTDDWRAWIPIFFCASMVALIPLATLLWDKRGRIALIGLYGLTMCVGMLGLFFHSDNHFMERLLTFFSVWTSSVQSGAEIKAAYPPLLAPLSLVGLGSIGLIFCISSNEGR